MIFLSDEATDVKAIVNCWIKKQPEEMHMKLEGWMEDHFYK